MSAQEPDYAATLNGVWLGPTVNAHAGINGEMRRMIIRNIRTYVQRAARARQPKPVN